MGGVGFHFHAESRELVGLAEGWAARDGLVVAVERFFPDYVVEMVDGAEVASAVVRIGEVDRVVFGLASLDVRAGSSLEMLDRNPECMALLIGRLGSEGLRESWLHGRAGDEGTQRLWRRIVRRERARMHRGARVRGVNTGIVEPQPSHRHTPGAHALAEQGVTMLALAGGNEYVFDDVELNRRS